MKKFQHELFVTTAENNLYDKECYNFRNLFVYRKGFKLTFHKIEDTLPIIIDKFKPLFGLESMKRDIVMFPSQDKYYIENHKGYERFIKDSEINEYEVFKIRVFRWMVGLSFSKPQNDIIVRVNNGNKSYISYRENEIREDRELRIGNSSERYNPESCILEMISGFTSSSLKKELSDIIYRIDKNYIFIADSIVRKLHSYDYI